MSGNLQSVQDAITCSPTASTRRLSRELQIPQTTVWKTLRYKNQKRAHHTQGVHNLEAEGYAARQAMCNNLLQAVENDNLMQNFFFSDEATFQNCGHMNIHNCGIQEDGQSSVMQTWQQDTAKENAWLGTTMSTVQESFMFAEQAVTGTTYEAYEDMLKQFLDSY